MTGDDSEVRDNLTDRKGRLRGGGVAGDGPAPPGRFACQA